MPKRNEDELEGNGSSEALELIMKLITAQYVPCYQYRDATVRLTTQEILEKFKTTLPNSDVNDLELIFMLKEEGFVLFDLGDMSMVWLFKEV